MQNQLENRVCAGFFVRLVAFAIDSLIIGLIVGMVSLPFAFVPADAFIKVNFIFDYSLLDVFRYVGVAAYFVLITYFAHATPGKLLMGLEVITADGSFTFINILYRETIGRFLSSLLNIGYLVVLGTKHHQGFHDMLCDTYVVYKNMMPAPRLQTATADPGVGQAEEATVNPQTDVSAPGVPEEFTASLQDGASTESAAPPEAGLPVETTAASQEGVPAEGEEKRAESATPLHDGKMEKPAVPTYYHIDDADAGKHPQDVNSEESGVDGRQDIDMPE